MRKPKTKAKKTEAVHPPMENENDPGIRPGGDSAGGNDTREPKTEGATSTVAPLDEAAELRGKVEKLEDALLRARAEYQNFQRRTAIERAEAIRYANAGLMKSLLSVLDDFERAMSSPTGESETVAEGVRLVYQNLFKALREHGLEAIETGSEPFDPSVHEAMMQQPSADHPAGTILEEFAKGYRLRDRVLRPSKVVVSKAVESETDDNTAADKSDAAEHAKKQTGS